MNRPAPIGIFIFNRPEHLRRTLTSLAQCDGFSDSPIVVFGDGPKFEGQLPQVEAARVMAREILGHRAVYQFADSNKGLARSIIDGVNALTEEHDRAIVVEDDLALAPGFLSYMNAALERYADDERVYQVAGHAFDAPELASRTNAVLLPFTTTWGWATWRRAWRQFDEAAHGWKQLESNSQQRERFNLRGVYDYAIMLERQMRGKGDSWGIRWYWTVFSRDGLAVYPPGTLVRNNGMDGSGSHGRGFFRRFKSTGREWPTATFDLPEPILDEQAFAAVRQAIYRQNGGAFGRFVDIVKDLTRR